MEVQNLVPVDYANQRVLLTAQVAEVYKCSRARIKDNFRLAREQFKEGVHFFKVSGDALRQLKQSEGFAMLGVSKMASCLYLWTKQGVARHCKMLNTPQAWDMFDALEKHYFNPATHVAPPVEEKPQPAIAVVDFTALVERMDRLELLVQTLIEGLEGYTAALNKQLSKADCADKLLTVAREMDNGPDRQKLLLHAANHINGKKIF